MASPTEGEENATATMIEFPGCGEVPGEVCYLEKDPGTCKESFSVRWFYDVAYGGCSRDGKYRYACPGPLKKIQMHKKFTLKDVQ